MCVLDLNVYFKRSIVKKNISYQKVYNQKFYISPYFSMYTSSFLLVFVLYSCMKMFQSCLTFAEIEIEKALK